MKIPLPNEFLPLEQIPFEHSLRCVDGVRNVNELCRSFRAIIYVDFDRR